MCAKVQVLALSFMSCFSGMERDLSQLPLLTPESNLSDFFQTIVLELAVSFGLSD